MSLSTTTPPLFVEAQFDSSSKMNFGQDPKQCPPFQCRRKKKEQQEPVPKWPIQLKSPGCSQGGAIMKMKTDDEDEDDVLLSCCDQRNACLQTCGSLTVVCEQAFMACGEQVCAALDNDNDGSNCTRSLQLQKLLHTISPTYCDDYYRAQKQNCQCVSIEDAPQARMEFLTKFYDKYDDNDSNNNNNQQKAKSLATKADTPRKMSTLVGKLIMKYYPETITRIKDPQQERMEQMMKDATNANAGKTKETKNKQETSTKEETEDDDTVEDLGVEEL